MFNKEKFIRQQTDLFIDDMIEAGILEASRRLEERFGKISKPTDMTEEDAYQIGVEIGNNAARKAVETGRISEGDMTRIAIMAMLCGI